MFDDKQSSQKEIGGKLHKAVCAVCLFPLCAAAAARRAPRALKLSARAHPKQTHIGIN